MSEFLRTLELARERLERERAQNARMRLALQDIVDPIAALRRYAKERGCELDGHVAVQLANDPHHLKGIARAALKGSPS